MLPCPLEGMGLTNEQRFGIFDETRRERELPWPNQWALLPTTFGGEYQGATEAITPFFFPPSIFSKEGSQPRLPKTPPAIVWLDRPCSDKRRSELLARFLGKRVSAWLRPRETGYGTFWGVGGPASQTWVGHGRERERVKAKRRREKRRTHF